MSTYNGLPLGTIGDLGALSFHETKNIICGEGGALLCRDPELAERAEIVREKGTNRSRFFRGQVDKYTWVDIGSSFLPGEITAAFLASQMQDANEITSRRMAIWNRYHAWAAPLEHAGRVRRPIIPDNCTHNAHMYYLLLPTLSARSKFIESLKSSGIQSVFHYIPLHSAPAGRKYGRAGSRMNVTDHVSNCLVRLPLWIGLEEHQEKVLEAASNAL